MSNPAVSVFTPDPDFFYETVYTVAPDDIDRLQHMNNTVYLRLMEMLAWVHSQILGISADDFVRLGAGMAVRQHEMNYLAALLEGEEVRLQTWIGREQKTPLQMHRYFRFIRTRDGKVVFEGRSHYVCIHLESGRPQRMPPEFRTAYGVK